MCELFHCVCAYYRNESANVTILMALLRSKFNLTVLTWRHFGHICSAILESYRRSNHCSKSTATFQLFHCSCMWSFNFSFFLYPEPLFASDSWGNGVSAFAVNLLISRGPCSQSFGPRKISLPKVLLHQLVLTNALVWYHFSPVPVHLCNRCVLDGIYAL